MELLKQEQRKVVITTYTIQLDDLSVVHYSEHVDCGEVVDVTIRSKGGVELDDPQLYDDLTQFIDKLNN